jgi:hypothetical protein
VFETGDLDGCPLKPAPGCWRPRCLHMSRQRSVSTARQASMTMAVLSLRP